MEVILKQDVNKVGKAGAVVKVKDGYARNFLLRNNLALPVTENNIKRLESEKQKKISQLEKIKKEALDLKERLSSVSITITALVQEQEKESLYGSVTNQDIAKALKDEGFEIDKNIIMLDEPIKSLGIYEVPVSLHAEVSASVKVWIVKK